MFRCYILHVAEPTVGRPAPLLLSVWVVARSDNSQKHFTESDRLHELARHQADGGSSARYSRSSITPWYCSILAIGCGLVR